LLGALVLVTWLGYSVFYYGLDQIQGGNNGFWSLTNPFVQFVLQPKDGATGQNTVPTGSPAATAAATLNAGTSENGSPQLVKPGSSGASLVNDTLGPFGAALNWLDGSQ
jgi:hypothetical protein